MDEDKDEDEEDDDNNDHAATTTTTTTTVVVATQGANHQTKKTAQVYFSVDSDHILVFITKLWR